MKFKFFRKKQDNERLKLIKEVNHSKGYNVLRDSKTIDDQNTSLLELAREYDEFGYIDEKVGTELDELFLDKNYAVGIHRTGFTIMSEDVVQDIFNYGLINNGHAFQGAENKDITLENTVSFFSSIIILSGQLKASPSYKESDGCIIVKIPKSYLGEKPGEIKPIYYHYNDTIRLLPEFVYGYVPVDKQGRIETIIRNPNYREYHVYSNEGLIYENGVLPTNLKK